MLELQDVSCNLTLTLGLTMLTPKFPIDVIILVLPIPLLWSLQMPLPKKLGLIGILATGIL